MDEKQEPCDKGLKIDEICVEGLVEEPQGHERASLDNLELSIDMIKDCSEKGVVGGGMTYLALKNQTSYLIGTSERGLKVIERDNQVFSGKLPEDNLDIIDLVYVPSINSYLFCSWTMLYRKEINHRPPYRWMAVRFGGRIGGFLRGPPLHHRLVINKQGESIALINPKTRKVEIAIKNNFRATIFDFKLFGEKEDRVAAVTVNGYVIVYNIDFDGKRGVVAHYHEQLDTRKLNGLSIAVCPRNEYLCVEIEADRYSSRILIFQLTVNSLIQKACISTRRQGIKTKFALEWLGYFGNDMFWVGLPYGDNAVAQVYDYDRGAQELKELEEMREVHQEDRPVKLIRLGDKLYYTGRNGRLMRLGVRR